MPQPPATLDSFPIPIRPKDKIDVTSLDQIAHDVTFSDIVDADISVIQTYAILSESKNISSIFSHIQRNDLLFLRSLCLRSYNADPINFTLF
jgi:hypothetical protein